LRRDAAAAADPEQARMLGQKASVLEQVIRMRLERFKGSAG
jgi:hypothetical protein